MAGPSLRGAKLSAARAGCGWTRRSRVMLLIRGSCHEVLVHKKLYL